MPLVPSLVVGTVGVLFVVAAPTPLTTVPTLLLPSTPTRPQGFRHRPRTQPGPRHRRSSAAAISNDLNRTATFQTPSGHLTSLLPPFPNPPRRQYPSKSLRHRHWSYQRTAYPMLLQNRATDSNMAADPLRHFKLRRQLQLRLSASQTGSRP
ncbi:hypothetical protein C8R43DRAFT_485099 [Mycena crocata]|nr:hypothetical protein C8R43DRAFT_485099 [Mycena crocata]